jgi:hypothetical protein
MDLTRVDIGRKHGHSPVHGKTAGAYGAAPADFDVKVERHGPYSMALFNAGEPLVRRIEVKNNSLEAIHNLVITVELLPDYGRRWDKWIGTMGPKERVVFETVEVPLYVERLLSVRETEKAWLMTEISSNSIVLCSKTMPIPVLAFNEWTFQPASPESLAGYVLPNSPAVEEIIGKAGPYLSGLRGDDAFDGYQAGDRTKLEDMVHAIYLVMQKGLNLKYINPPASFENESQKILVPGAIMDMGRGSCLDLALCFAGCLERIGLNPVVFLIPGHALLGVWMDSGAFNDFHVRKSGTSNGQGLESAALPSFIGERYKKYVQLIRDGAIMPLNSITFTGERGFDACKEEGRSFCLKADTFEAVVDVSDARGRVKPLPV